MSQSSDEATLALLKKQFPDAGLRVAKFRDQTQVLVPRESLHAVLKFLREDEACAFDFLCDIAGIDYLDYPQAEGRFGVVYNLISTSRNHRFFVKVVVDPSRL